MGIKQDQKSGRKGRRIYHLLAYKSHHLTIYFFALKRSLSICHIKPGHSYQCPLIWGFISKTRNIFRNILCFTCCSFLQSSRDAPFLRLSNFCAKRQYFFALIFLQTLKKVPWRNYVRFWKWILKCKPQSTEYSFPRKSKLKFCIILGTFHSSAPKVQSDQACSKVLLLIN